MADNEEKVVSTTETDKSNVSTEDKSKENVIDWSKVDWSKAQIPESAIKESPAYKSVLTESVERRQKIATLNSQITALSSDKPIEDKQPEPDKLTKLEQEINALKALTNTTNVANARTQAIAEHKIPEKFQNLITGDTPDAVITSAKNIAEALKSLPASPLTTSTAYPGATDNTDEAIANAIINRITGKGPQNDPFSVGNQKRMGGGGIKN